MTDRVITAAAQPRTRRSRPPSARSDWPSTSGQQAVREQMAIYIEAARRRAGALDHVLIFGPPGLGKTTLGHVIANELGVNVRSTSGPVLERAGDLAALLTNLEAATCCSSTRSIASRRWSRKCCIRRWRISRSTS